MIVEITEFVVDDSFRKILEQIGTVLKPERMLMVGSNEGSTESYLIDILNAGRLEIFCVEDWNYDAFLSAAKEAENLANQKRERFHQVMFDKIMTSPKIVDLFMLRQGADVELPRLIVSGRRSYFDFVFVESLRMTKDVLRNAVQCFELLRPNGVMCFSDYQIGTGELGARYKFNPKVAIDAFVNIYSDSLRMVPTNQNIHIIQKIK